MATVEQLRAVLEHINHRYASPDGWSQGLTLPESIEIGGLRLQGKDGFVDDAVIDRLRQLHPDVFDATTGQPLSCWAGEPGVKLPAPANPGSPPPLFPGPAELPGPTLTDPVQVSTHFADLDRGEGAQHRRGAKTVKQEMIDGFEDGLDAVRGVDDGAAPHGGNWDGRIQGVQEVLERAKISLRGIKGFEGAAGEAIRNNLERAEPVLQEMRLHAQAMGLLFEDFFKTLATTTEFFKNNEDNYNAAKGNGNSPPPNDDLLKLYDDLAQQVIEITYNPPIQGIASRHPNVSLAAPEVNGDAPAVPTSSRPSGPPAGPSSPATARPPGDTGPATTSPVRNSSPSAPNGKSPMDSFKGVGDAAKSAGDAAKGVGDAAQKGLSGVGDAAGKGLNALSGLGKGGPQVPPEGQLNLAGAGGHGLPKTGTGGHSGGSRGTAGAPTNGLKPTTQMPSPTKAAAAGPAAGPTSRAGVSGTGAAGGSGAPAAGHQAGAGKQHKAGKELRRVKNGVEVLGDVEAVTPVVGAAPPKPPPAKPGS